LNCYLLPKSGRIVLLSSEEMDGESDDAVVPDGEEALPINAIESTLNQDCLYGDITWARLISVGAGE
jgi:hypothetical protein